MTVPTQAPAAESQFWINGAEIVFGGAGKKSLLMILRSAAVLARDAAVALLLSRDEPPTTLAIVDGFDALCERARGDTTPHQQGTCDRTPDVVVAVARDHVTVGHSPLATADEIALAAVFFLRCAYGIARSGNAVLDFDEFAHICRALAIGATLAEEA